MTTHLRELEADSLWVAEEPHNLLGVPVGARSTIIKLRDGGLWVHSPIEPTPELRRELEEIGPIRAIVAPTRAHTVYPSAWADLYPEAALWVSPKWTKTLPREPQVLGKAPEAWREDLQQTTLEGNILLDEVEFFHARSKTLILCDLLFNLPPSLPPGQKLLAKMLGFAMRPAPSRLERVTTKDNKALRASLRRILEWDFERIILSHGLIVERDGRQVLHDAFDWLWRGEE